MKLSTKQGGIGEQSTLATVKNRYKYIRENHGKKTRIEGRVGNYIDPPGRGSIPKKEAKKILSEAHDEFFRDLRFNRVAVKEENIKDNRKLYFNKCYNHRIKIRSQKEEDRKNKIRNKEMRERCQKAFTDFVSSAKRDEERSEKEIEYLAKRYFLEERAEKIAILASFFNADLTARERFAEYFKGKNNIILNKIDMWAFGEFHQGFREILKLANAVLPEILAKKEWEEVQRKKQWYRKRLRTA